MKGFAAVAPLGEGAARAALKRASQRRLNGADDERDPQDRQFNAAHADDVRDDDAQGLPQDNVLPTSAEAIVNCRILPDETTAQTRATLEKIVGDKNVAISEASDFGEGPPSPFEGEVIDTVKKVGAATFPGMPIVPSMSNGGTDSRHLRKIGIPSYGVSPNVGSRAEGRAAHAAHGPDERKPVKWLEPGALYFRVDRVDADQLAAPRPSARRSLLATSCRARAARP